jgi:ABC-type multidrug transport system ATPase subunit
METQVMIDVVDCRQHYGVRPVLRGVNLQIRKGELVALMGPNGMGKSSLLAVMAGILPPSSGHVEIDGKRRRSSVENERAIRKITFYLPADMWLPAFRCAREWLLAVGRLYELEDEHLMAHEERLIELFELKDVADSTLTSLSTGQRKKVCLSAALISEAQVMLLDEPFAGGLDPGGILALKRVLLHLRDSRKATVVLATPVPELVEDLADRIALLRDGQVVAFDSLEGLRRTTGSTVGLDELYARLVNPDRTSKIDAYLQGGNP